MKKRSFKTRYEVAQYLKGRGFKISQAKVYQAVEKGLLRVNTDGTVPHDAVQEYISTHLSELEVGADENLKDITIKKLEKEYEKLCQQVEMLKFQRERQEGLHIPIAEYEAQIASRAAVFESMLRQSNETVVGRLISAGGLKPSKRQQAVDLMNDGLMDALAAYVAQDEIIGIVVAGDDEGE